MDNKKNSGVASSTGFFDLLGIAFIVLKLCGVIDWSWWIVLAPIWGSLVLIIVILLIAFVMAWRKYK